MRKIAFAVLALVAFVAVEMIYDKVFVASRASGDAKNNTWFRVDDDADTAIVFVHGIRSNSDAAWRYRGEDSDGAYWPALVEADDSFDGTAIFLGGYHSRIDSHDYGFRQAADELYTALDVPGEGAGRSVLDRPNVLFVAHSAGGIVVRTMLANRTEHFTDKTVGLMLVASPSSGSAYADFVGPLMRWLRIEQVDQLTVDSGYLRELNARFSRKTNAGEFPGLVGVELVEHRGLFGRFFGILTGSRVVESDKGAHYFEAPKLIPDEDHASIVKPTGLGHRTHKELSSFYNDRFQKAMATTERRLTANAEGPGPAVEPTARHQTSSDPEPPDVAGNDVRIIETAVDPGIIGQTPERDIRVYERHATSLCGGRVRIEVRSVWRKDGGRPDEAVTVASAAIEGGRTRLGVGETLTLDETCATTLVDTGRDGKYYAIFR